MKRFGRSLKIAAVSLTGVAWLGFGGCLPENFWADKWGEIVNGIIISGVNILLDGTGLAV